MGNVRDRREQQRRRAVDAADGEAAREVNGFRRERLGGTRLQPPIPILGLRARPIAYRLVEA